MSFNRVKCVILALSMATIVGAETASVQASSSSVQQQKAAEGANDKSDLEAESSGRIFDTRYSGYSSGGIPAAVYGAPGGGYYSGSTYNTGIGLTSPAYTTGYSGYSGLGTGGYSGYSGLGTGGYSGYSGLGTGYTGYSGLGSGYNGYSGYNGLGNGYNNIGYSSSFYPTSSGGYGGYGGNGGLGSYSGYNNPYYYSSQNNLGYGYYGNGIGYRSRFGATPSIVSGYRGYTRK